MEQRSLLFIFAHPDDEVSFSGMAIEALLQKKIAGMLEEISPDIVATFPPDGITRHPDHLAIRYVTKRAFYEVCAAHKNQELYYWCRGSKNFYQTLLRETPERILEKHGWELESVTPTIQLDVRHHLSQKLKALYCHEGQRLIGYLRSLNENDIEDFLGYEYFFTAFSGGHSYLPKIVKNSFE